MKRQLECLTCGQTFFSEDETSEHDMPCPACGVPLAAVSQPLPVLVPAEPARPQIPEAAEPEIAEENAASRVGHSGAEPIICPRCGLHFQQERARTRRRRPRRLTVLVVEDMDYFRDLAQVALQDVFDVRTAENTESARAALGAGGVDLLLLNPAVGGHHGNGIRLLGELPFKPCPILIYTDADESVLYGELWERLQRLGADDVVMKGMNAGEALLRKVAELLNEPLDDHEAAAAS